MSSVTFFATFSSEMFETFPVNVFLKRFTPAENKMSCFYELKNGIIVS